MSVRAKFKVINIRRSMGSRPTGVKDDRGYEKHEPCEIQTIEMSPVYGNNDPNHENSKFWRASPSGKLELGCINLEAARQFELDKEYYLDFTLATE